MLVVGIGVSSKYRSTTQIPQNENGIEVYCQTKS